MAPEEARPELPAELGSLTSPNEPIWDTYYREASRFRTSNIDVFFLAFLRRVERFGYFTLGPVTIDVRMIEDIVERTTLPNELDPPPFGDDLTRFSRVLMEEVQRSGRRRIDDLHVLLALMRFPEGLPARVFGELGVTPEQVEEYVKSGGEITNRNAERLYSPEEAAEYLGVHVQTVRGWIRSGRLKASRLAGQRALRIRASDLGSILEPVDPAELD
ncbi:MAG: helix-turn-helix domain-containing protein [Dehalococcoidia bacterium]